MTMVDVIPAFFGQIDMPLHTIPNHPHATLWPSAVVPPGILHALTGVDNRAFYHWPTRDYGALVPGAPRAHPPLSPLQDPSGVDGTVLAAPTVLGVIAPYGIELMHACAGTRRHFRRDKAGYGCPVCVCLWPSFVRPPHGTWSRDDERLQSLTEEERR
jgi:hypothetical protein